MSTSGPTTKDTSAIALGLAQIRVGPATPNIAQVGQILAPTYSIGALGKTNYMSKIDFFKLESGFPLNEDMVIPIRETQGFEVTFKEMTPANLALARGIDIFAGYSATVGGGSIKSTAGTVTGTITVADNAGPINEEWTVIFTGANAGQIYGKVTGHVHDFVALDAAMEPANGANDYFSIPISFFTGTWAADDSYTFYTTAYQASGSAYTDAHSGQIALGGLTAPEFVRMEAIYTYPNQTNHLYVIFPRCNVVSSISLDFKSETNTDVTMTFEAKRADSGVIGGDAVWDNLSLGRVYFD